MTQEFAADVVAAVTRHMNDDHAEDGLLIVRAFAQPDARSAVMTSVDGDGGTWTAVVDGRPVPARVPWPEPVTERSQLRPAVVALYRSACEALGVAARPEH